MSTDRDVTRIVRSWLEEGTTVLPDRVLDTVLDQLPATPQRRSRWPARRLRDMNSFAKFAIAAAAVVVVALVGINLLPKSGGIGGPGQTASPSPTLTPPATASPGNSIAVNPGPTTFPMGGPLAAGTYVIGDPFVLNVSLTVPEDWIIWSGLSIAGGAIYKDSPDPPNGKGVVVTTVDEIYANACDNTEGLIDPGPTTDDLATALANQPRTLATPITDVTLDGYAGTYVEYSFEGPEPGCTSLNRWSTRVGSRQAIEGESDKVWILDVDGVRLVIDAFFFPEASAADRAEIQQIVETIHIEP